MRANIITLKSSESKPARPEQRSFTGLQEINATASALKQCSPCKIIVKGCSGVNRKQAVAAKVHANMSTFACAACIEGPAHYQESC